MFVLCLFFMSLREEKRVFQKRLMCEVEFFGRCFKEGALPFLLWSK